VKLEMRREPLGWFIDPVSKGKISLCHEVLDLHSGGQTVAWISNWRAGETWHIQRFEAGVPGKETGSYSTVDEAFDVLQQELG
jgi:hypothetical protein